MDLVWLKEISSSRLYQNKPLSIPFSKNFHSFQNKIFYYNPSGEIQHSISFGEDMQISAGQLGYTTYQKIGKQIQFHNNKGQMLWKLSSFSYPLCSPSGKRILLLSTDASSISLYDFEKNCLLPEKFIDTLILDMDFCPTTHSVVLGTSSGKIICFNQEGEQLFLSQSTPSQYNYIKTVSYAEDGTYIATLANLAPERLSLFYPTGKRVWEISTGLSRRKSTSIYIDTKNSLLLDQNSQSIAVRNLKNGTILYNLDFRTSGVEKIRSTKIHSQKELILICLNTETTNQVYAYLLTKQGTFLWQKIYTDPHVLHAEISKDRKYFQIQLSQGAYCYRIQGGDSF